MAPLRGRCVTLLVAASWGCSPATVDAPPWPPPPAAAVAPLSVLDVQAEAEAREGGPPAITVSVVTQGSAERAVLLCRVKRADGVVAEATTDFAPAGTTSTRLRLWREDGWAAGPYRLEVELDGRAVAARELRVGNGS